MKNHHDKELSRPAAAARRLEAYFREQPQALVAFSGGVDSSLLAFVAHRALGSRMLAVLADSPSLPRREYRQARDFARRHGIPLEVVPSTEMEVPQYLANSADRCYFCKKNLFETIAAVGRRLLGADGPIFFGANTDDLGDFRPGNRAAEEAGVKAPYLELEFDETTVRAVCAHYGL